MIFSLTSEYFLVCNSLKSDVHDKRHAEVMSNVIVHKYLSKWASGCYNDVTIVKREFNHRIIWEHLKTIIYEWGRFHNIMSEALLWF